MKLRYISSPIYDPLSMLLESLRYEKSQILTSKTQAANSNAYVIPHNVAFAICNTGYASKFVLDSHHKGQDTAAGISVNCLLRSVLSFFRSTTVMPQQHFGHFFKHSHLRLSVWPKNESKSPNTCSVWGEGRSNISAVCSTRGVPYG